MLDHIPQMTIPLFESGQVYFCGTRKDWKYAHEVMGSNANMLDRRGGANTFKSMDGGLDVHLLGVFDDSASTLAHESAHLVFDICETVGVDIEKGKANETFCHLLDKIVEFGNQQMLVTKL